MNPSANQPATPHYSSTPGAPSAEQSPNQATPPDNKFKRHWRRLVVIVGVLVLIACAVIIILDLHSDRAEKVAEAPALVAYLPVDIRQHNQRDDCWVIVDSVIYDVSAWEYPGSSDLAEVCGHLTADDLFERDNQPAPPEEYKQGVYVTEFY